MVDCRHARFHAEGRPHGGFLEELTIRSRFRPEAGSGSVCSGMAREIRKITSSEARVMTVADVDLLSRCLDGDSEAREEFVMSTDGLIRWTLVGTFRRYGRRLEEEDLEDLRQEVLLALFRENSRKLRQYEGRNGASLATWLRVVVTRLAIDRIRSLAAGENVESLETRSPAGIPDVAVEDSGPESAAVASEQRQHVLGLIAELSPGDQLFVRLFYYQDATMEEVSKVMGISRNAAYVRKMRLHRRLRSLLEHAS